MAAKKKTAAGCEFLVAALKKNKKAVYADLRAKAEKIGAGRGGEIRDRQGGQGSKEESSQEEGRARTRAPSWIESPWPRPPTEVIERPTRCDPGCAGRSTAARARKPPAPRNLGQNP